MQISPELDLHLGWHYHPVGTSIRLFDTLSLIYRVLPNNLDPAVDHFEVSISSLARALSYDMYTSLRGQ